MLATQVFTSARHSVTQLDVFVPWAALNTQQVHQPFPQSLIIFLTFLGGLEEGSLPFMWESMGNTGSVAKEWAMSQLRDYESRLTGRPTW